MRVTVIIPCYNQAQFLPRAVASLQSQTIEDWECIVVDDGSTDNTAEVASVLAANEPRIRLLQKKNGGSAAARDLGLSKARGKYIQFLDADDYIAPQKLEKQVIVMENENLDISYTAFCHENNYGEQTPPKVIKLNLYKILVNWGLGASMPIHSFLYRTNFLYKNKIICKSNCRYREDWQWHIQCFTANPLVDIISDYCGAIYYQNEQGKTGSYIKMQEGNFVFMSYMATNLSSKRNKMLWSFRISEELWIWMLRMIKYKSSNIVSSIKYLWSNTSSIKLFTIALFFLPISFLHIVVYYFHTYILNDK